MSLCLDEGLVLGRDLEVRLEVRLVSDSGLLLHAGSGQQLSLYLNQGEVRLTKCSVVLGLPRQFSSVSDRVICTM